MLLDFSHYVILCINVIFGSAKCQSSASIFHNEREQEVEEFEMEDEKEEEKLEER